MSQKRYQLALFSKNPTLIWQITKINDCDSDKESQDKEILSRWHGKLRYIIDICEMWLKNVSDFNEADQKASNIILGNNLSRYLIRNFFESPMNIE